MPMNKIQAVKKEILNAILNGSEETQAEAAKMASSLAKAKRLGTLDEELAELAKRLSVEKKEVAPKEES
eukprot:CAMPEP_0185900776 /NCGR_PEP_ID=MMETSP0196C-20130402/246_1 /TAXON_ID=2932 /ORGANISM="Alexandrium fundyense, Strain CCMP1719" /LENGTH=68 /DNA_ID=CAMNT_0028619309 /DNA_START=119 /DNA_END=325 /DNA_ORIENTATION=+